MIVVGRARRRTFRRNRAMLLRELNYFAYTQARHNVTQEIRAINKLQCDIYGTIYQEKWMLLTSKLHGLYN